MIDKWYFNCLTCGARFWRRGNPKFCSLKCSSENQKNLFTGKPLSKEHKRKLREASKKKPSRARGFHLSIEHRRKISEANKGEKNYGWRGGLTPVNKKIRGSLEYKLWREAVFKRDNWTCIWCGIKGSQTGGTLNADHIKPFAYFPELRFAIDNGRTLCVPCHKRTDTYKKKIKNIK